MSLTIPLLILCLLMFGAILTEHGARKLAKARADLQRTDEQSMDSLLEQMTWEYPR